ncbi:MAG: ROK family protein [Candidatus Borkfalkiaceae bacterium]|nr:ROK family protein [Christensenellaceae bacterium]
MYYIGLDIGGTKCAATLGDIKHGVPEIKEKEYFLTAGQEPAVILERFSAFIKEQLKTYKISGIGISCGGPLDSKRGIIMRPPSLPLWDNIEIVKYFENKFGIKTYLQNDANACAVAEWKFGAGKGAENMIFLTFGTGFGAGLILNGRLYSGTNDNAGEIGHVRLTEKGPLGYYKEGSCEGYCSGSGIARLAEIMSKLKRYKDSYDEYIKAVGNEITAKTIAEQARKGNSFCQAVYKNSGEMLGRTLSILVDVLNPERIVIGGVYMRSHDLLYPHAIKVMNKECLSFSLEKAEILPAGLKENIGDYAALSIAQGDF